MREVKTGGQFRKDLKRYRNDNTKLEKLYEIVGFLERCEDVPKEFKPHMLSGDYAGVTCTFHSNISPCVNLKNDGFSDFTGTLLSFIKK